LPIFKILRKAIIFEKDPVCIFHNLYKGVRSDIVGSPKAHMEFKGLENTSCHPNPWTNPKRKL